MPSIYIGKLRPREEAGSAAPLRAPPDPYCSSEWARSLLCAALSLCYHPALSLNVTGDFGRAGLSPSHSESPVPSRGYAQKRHLVSVANGASLTSDGKWLPESAGLQARPP